jgi:uncharacterized protein (UPF0276 family)
MKEKLDKLHSILYKYIDGDYLFDFAAGFGIDRNNLLLMKDGKVIKSSEWDYKMVLEVFTSPLRQFLERNFDNNAIDELYEEVKEWQI